MDIFRKPAALTLAALLILALCACGGKNATVRQVETIRERYRTMEGYTASAELVADCSGKIYQYTADLAGDQTTGRLTVTAPENIAGCSVAWDEKGLVLDWESLTLETGKLRLEGLAPVDAMAAVLNCCLNGVLVECRPEQEGAALYAQFQNPKQEECTALCWFDAESGGLQRAELCADGETVVTMIFTDFVIKTWEMEDTQS